MPAQMEELLTCLEDLTARTVDRSDPARHSTVDTCQLLEMVRQRGELIQQLSPALAASAPVSYIVWNRLVIIYHQGDRISENLGQIRTQLALEVNASSSGRMFLQRLNGLLPPPSICP